MNSAVVLPGKVLFSRVSAQRAWTVALALLGLAGIPLSEGIGAESDGEDDLYQRQVDVRATLQHVSASMQRLADKLKETQPEDARRLMEAAEKIRVVGLEGLLSEIGDLLKKPNFLEAVLRQDEAIRELDGIIALLERARTEGGADDERQKSLEALLRQVSEVTGRQESLLKKTRDILGKEETVQRLGELKGELSDIAKKQGALNEGADPREADPQAERDDEAALDEALALAQELLDAQKKVEERTAAVSTEKVPLDEVRSLADRLDGLIEQAEDLVGGLEPASAGAEEAPQAKAGAGGRPEGREPPGGKTAGEEAAGEKSAVKSERESAGGKSPEGKSAGEKTPGEKAAGEENAKDASKSPVEAGEPDDSGKESTPAPPVESGEGKEGSLKPPAREDAPATSPGVAEKSRDRNLIQQARGISEEISALEEDVSRDAPSAKESIAKARSEAARAEAELRANSRDRALASGKGLLRELKKARKELGRELGGLEEKNASETAGIVQEQGLLEKKASEGAARTESGAQKSSSEAVRSSMADASQAMKEASGSMREAAESLAGGDRPKGREASARAAQDLARARDALRKGKEALAGRTAAERAADLQKKLARKTGEAAKKVEELQKKIGKKAPEPQQALAEAESLMKEAAGARQAGDLALAKKKGEEALDRIQKASRDLDEEEKLARLRKESPRKDAAEQEALARLTRDLSKQARESGGSSQGARGQSQDLREASESMEQAGQDLQKEDAESAARDQEEALAKLKKARDQLEEEQQELARLNKERDMTSMVEELTKIKERQESINSETVKIHASRQPQEGRRERLKRQDVVSRLVLSQGELAEQVDKLSERLQEELSRVFHFVLQNVGADMRQVRDYLKELETGAYTQFLEKEIVDDIDRLLASLKEELSRLSRKESPPMPMGEEDVRRLVPLVAELRMLRGMQVEVNRKTRDLDDLRKASTSGATESWDRALERLMQKQGSVSRMTGELLEDFRKATGPAAPEGPEPPKE